LAFSAEAVPTGASVRLPISATTEAAVEMLSAVFRMIASSLFLRTTAAGNYYSYFHFIKDKQVYCIDCFTLQAICYSL
jgi:hypothetical protein